MKTHKKTFLPFKIDIPKKKERRKKRRSFSILETFRRLFRFFYVHPLFLLFGVWYAVKGELFLFLLSALVAIQHECAHAFAAAKLGYKLNRIVLMPFGAVIDGDLKNVSLKDEIFVAACGPICNVVTAVFFAALWWLYPSTYAFTDTACYSSLAIAAVNLLPAYPLDGGRILKCALARIFLSQNPQENQAEKRAASICRVITFSFAALLLLIFILQCIQLQPNLSLLAFSLFLLVGAIGNRDKTAVYSRIDFSLQKPMKNGVEIRRVAVFSTLPVKNALKFLSKGSYLVLEVYDSQENHLFDLPQNELSEWFSKAESPYQSLESLYESYFSIS